jgi:hypothetical protein
MFRFMSFNHHSRIILKLEMKSKFKSRHLVIDIKEGTSNSVEICRMKFRFIFSI